MAESIYFKDRCQTTTEHSKKEIVAYFKNDVVLKCSSPAFKLLIQKQNTFDGPTFVSLVQEWKALNSLATAAVAKLQ